MKKKDLSKLLIEVQKLRVEAYLQMRLFYGSGDNKYGKEIAFALAKLFLIEDNWGFWEAVKRNKFWRYDNGNKLVKYYDSLQEWYNQYSKQERDKDEWLYFGDIKLPWKKEKVEFNSLMNEN